MTFRYGNMQETAGYHQYNPMTSEEGLMLRHLLIGGDAVAMPDGTPIPKNIRELHGNVRDLLNELWDRSDRADLEIGFAKSGFFPRDYDRHKAAGDKSGFLRAANEMYAFEFDKEIGTPGSNPQALLEKWTTMSADTRALAKNPTLETQMAELGANIREQARIKENPAPTPSRYRPAEGPGRRSQTAGYRRARCAAVPHRRPQRQ